MAQTCLEAPWKRLVKKKKWVKKKKGSFFLLPTADAYQYLTSLRVCDWSGHIFGASASPRSLTKKMAVPPSSTVHGGQHDTKCVAFELLMHAAFVADEIWGLCLNQLVRRQKTINYGLGAGGERTKDHVVVVSGCLGATNGLRRALLRLHEDTAPFGWLCRAFPSTFLFPASPNCFSAQSPQQIRRQIMLRVHEMTLRRRFP